MSEWWEAAGVTELVGSAMVRLLPTFLKLCGVLLVGWALTRLAARGTLWASRRVRLDELAERARVMPVLRRMGCVSLEEAMPRKVVWVGVALTLYLVVELLQLRALSRLFASLLGALPSLVAASAILLGGLAVAELAREVLRKLFVAQAPDHELAELVPNGAASALLVMAGALSAEQLGLDVWLVHALLLLTVGALAVGLVLGVALGATPLLRQLVARYYVQRVYARDDVLVVGEVSGRLRRFGPTVAVLERDDDPTRCLLIPYDELLRQRVRRVHRAA